MKVLLLVTRERKLAESAMLQVNILDLRYTQLHTKQDYLLVVLAQDVEPLINI